MPSKANYYNTLTVQAFRESVCDWIGLLNDCYSSCILLEQPIYLIFTDFPLQKVNERGEDVQLHPNQDDFDQLVAERCDANSARESTFLHLIDNTEDGFEDLRILYTQ